MGDKTLNILTWNATGIMSSASYLCDVLIKYNFDIYGISEHWLFQPNSTTLIVVVYQNIGCFNLTVQHW